MDTSLHAGDGVIDRIADYVSSTPDWHPDTLRNAGMCLADAMACALGSLDDPECARLLGPAFAGYGGDGVPVPGTPHRPDPIKAAFDIGTMIRWLDFSDTTYMGGHPSDTLGAVLAAAAHAGRQAGASPGPTMGDVVDAMVKAYEIHGTLTAENRFDLPAIGLDHVIGVKIASTAIAARLLGGDRDAVRRAVSNAWLDGQALNAYRHTPNAGTRKSWAAGDACSRGLWLAQLALRGDMGYPLPLSAPIWGFEAVYLDGRPVRLDADLGSYIVDHIIFKLYPCQRNATTAVESAIGLRPWLGGRIGAIRKIVIRTQDEAMRRIDKTGPLPNRAARDHCLQYVTAVALLNGALTSDDYSDERAADPRIDWLRTRMEVAEDPLFTREHHDPEIRRCANSIQIVLDTGETSPPVVTQYPIGDPSRRGEAAPLLTEKFHALTRSRWSAQRRAAILELMLSPDRLSGIPVREFMSLVAEPSAAAGG